MLIKKIILNELRAINIEIRTKMKDIISLVVYILLDFLKIN